MSEAGVPAAPSWAKVADKALDTVRSAGKFIERIAGPASNELGGLLADQAKFWRARNLNRLASKFEKIVRERGFNEDAMRQLPFGTAFLSLERASLEESDTVQELWARLFANALDSDREEIISKIHIDILGSLTELDAKLLMAKKEWEEAWPRFPYEGPAGQTLTRDEIQEVEARARAAAESRYGQFASCLSERELAVSLYNLYRLQLLAEPFAAFPSRESRMWSLRSTHQDPDFRELGRILEKLADAARSIDIEALAKTFARSERNAATLCGGILSKFEFTALGTDFMNAVRS